MSKIDLDESEKQARSQIVISSYGGIYPVFEVFYIQAVLYSATAADDAFERFARAVVREKDASFIVAAVQEALTHSAGLSRFFWPPDVRNKLANARGARLRIAFEMENSPLQARDLRNSLEHFDERLDDFLLADPVGNFFPGPLVDSHVLADEALGQIFRLIDPFEFVFVILGKKYEFLSIREEISRILKIARRFDEEGGRLRYPADQDDP